MNATLMHATPFSSPETRVALDRVMKFVRERLPSDLLDSHALALAFEPNETIDDGVKAACDELCAAMRERVTNESFAFSYTFAFGELLRGRIREIEASGRGSA